MRGIMLLEASLQNVGMTFNTVGFAAGGGGGAIRLRQAPARESMESITVLNPPPAQPKRKQVYL